MTDTVAITSPDETGGVLAPELSDAVAAAQAFALDASASADKIADFRKKWLGIWTDADHRPFVDQDNNPIVAGAFGINLSTQLIEVYLGGSVWVSSGPYWMPVQDWATGQPYRATPLANVLRKDGALYLTRLYHVSGVFADDLAAGKLTLLVAKGDVGLVASAGTSTSTNSITTGSELVFTTQNGLSWAPGLRARIAASTNVWIEGPISSYSGTTLKIIPDLSNGTGSYSSWAIGPASERGAPGPAGAGVDTITPNAVAGAKTAALGGNPSGDLSTRDFAHFNRRVKALVSSQHFTTARARMDKTVVLWGHSAVQGSGATSLGGDSIFATNRWYISGSLGYWLEQLLGWRWRAIAKGISAQWPEHVGARQGGVPTYITVTGNSIPAAGTTVALTAISPNGGPFRYRGAFANELYGTVNGVMCRLSTPGDAVDPPNYSIEQVSGGSPLAVAAGTRFVPYTDQLDSAINVFWHLRNGTLTVANAKQVTGMMIRKAIASGCERYVILGAWPFNAETTGSANNTAVLAINADLSDRYGAHFFDVSAFLRRQYPYDNSLYPSAFTLLGLTETANDTTDIGNGIIPRQFMSGDASHFNNTGYQAVAKGLIEIHFATLGYAKIAGAGVYQ